MTHVDNDRWRGVCTLYENATYEYTVEAWTDTFRGWQHEFAAKFEAGIANLTSETLEGAALLEAAAHARNRRRPMRSDCASSPKQFAHGENAEVNRIAHSGELEVSDGDLSRPLRRDPICAAAARDGRSQCARAPPPGMNFFRARPRAGAIAARPSATALPRIDDAKAMGFDVIYFPPIHPIGHTNRKGRNNSVTCEPGEPGVPYAIGSEGGGHKAIEPSLGTLEDFAWLENEIRQPRNGDRARFRDQLLARSSLRRASIRNGFTSGPTARSSTRKIRRRNTRTFIR